MAEQLRRTGLYDLLRYEGADMAPWGGWEMPRSFPLGTIGEHLHTRARASLFDLGHTPQVIVRPPMGETRAPAQALERLIPGDLLGLQAGRVSYAIFTDVEGGVLGDLLIARCEGHFLLFLNPLRGAEDLARLRSLPGIIVDEVTDRGLIGLRGPSAADVLSRLVPDAADLPQDHMATLAWQGADLWVCRTAHWGECGFEISVPMPALVDLALALLNQPEVAPAGFAACESLRMESGLPILGRDMDENISPAEALLAWTIPPVRRTGGARAGGFPGASGVLAELEEGPSRARRGLRPEGRSPLRPGMALFETETDGLPVGHILAGSFGATVGGPIAIGLLPPHLADDTRLWADLGERRIPVQITALPFAPGAGD